MILFWSLYLENDAHGTLLKTDYDMALLDTSIEKNKTIDIISHHTREKLTIPFTDYQI